MNKDVILIGSFVLALFIIVFYPMIKKYNQNQAILATTSTQYKTVDEEVVCFDNILYFSRTMTPKYNKYASMDTCTIEEQEIK